MNDNDQLCLFCGGKTKISKRQTGTDWLSTPTEHNKWDGKMVARYRYQVICNKCKSRGPLMKSEQEARDAYKIHTTTE